METAIKKQIVLMSDRVTTVNYVQGTDVIPIEFEVMDYELPANSEARIYIHKPSGKIIYNIEKISGQKITITPTSQMFSEIGKNYGNVEIVGQKNMKKIATFPILFLVAPNFRDEGALESKDEYEALIYYMTLSKSWAIGGTGIREGEDKNNSKYWSGWSESWAKGGTKLRTGEDTNNATWWSGQAQSYAKGGTGKRSGEDTDNAEYYRTQAHSYSSGGTGKRSGEDTDNSKYYMTMSHSYSSGNTGARTGENTDNAYYYKELARGSAAEAKNSEQNAAESEKRAKASENAAATSEQNAKTSETNAKNSEGAAANSAANAKTSERNSASSATEAQSYTKGGTGTRTGENTDNASYYKELAKSWARGDSNIRDGEITDNSKYYSEQSKLSANASASSAKDSETASRVVTEYLKQLEDDGSFVGPRGPQGENGKDAMVTDLDILYGFQIVGDQLCGYYSDKTSPPPFYIDGEGNLVFEIEDDDPISYGRVRGSYWWSGDKVSGTSTTPAVFDTGIDQVYKDDFYINTSAYEPSAGGSRGNVYRCAKPGNASTATWYYVGSILGPTADITPYRTELTEHKNDKSNPHGVTKAQVGLDKVDNTPDAEKKVASAAKLTTARTIAISGAATGMATEFDGSSGITIPVTSLDATKLTGTISLDNLPSGALERQITVTDDTARFALTTDNVQLGDTVKVQSTGLMYLVVDESKLDSENGYSVYTAGSASSVPWSGVTDKPEWIQGSTKPTYSWDEVSGKPLTFPPSSHIHDDRYYTETEIDTKLGDYVKTDDSRLSDARPASDVSEWAKAKTKPSYTYSEVGAAAATHSHGAFTGATANAAGAAGFVPAPSKGAQDSYLKGDGTWDSITGVVKGVKVDAAGTADTAKSVAWGNVSGKPSTFPPSSHTHVLDDITNWGEYIYSAKSTRTKRTVLAAPESADGVATFRALKKADISDFPSSMPASDVYSWAKASSKPSYSAGEVGAYTKSEVDTKLSGKQDSGYYARYGTAPTNLNDATTAGMYRVNDDHTNMPSGASGNGQLLVVRGANDTIGQIYFNYPNDSSWIRTGNPVGNSSGTWNSWSKIAFSSEIPTKVSQLTNDSGYKTTDTNTWRGITDSYSGTSTSISLSQKGANSLYNALVNGYASSAGSATKANKVAGTYSGNGGQQGPGYFGTNCAGFIMSNATVNGDTNYKNWLYMDNYNGSDVGGASAIGVDRMSARAFIMQSNANRSAWNNTAEILTTYNVTEATEAEMRSIITSLA